MEGGRVTGERRPLPERVVDLVGVAAGDALADARDVGGVPGGVNRGRPRAGGRVAGRVVGVLAPLEHGDMGQGQAGQRGAVERAHDVRRVEGRGGLVGHPPGHPPAGGHGVRGPVEDGAHLVDGGGAELLDQPGQAERPAPAGAQVVEAGAGHARIVPWGGRHC